jgi:hypothetical protein
MADPIRERIIGNLVADVTASAAVRTVDRMRRTKYQQHELPAINVWEGKERKEPGPSGLTTCHLPLLLEITVLDLSRHAAVANVAMAAVVNAVLADRQRGGLAVDTEENGSEPFIGEMNDPTGGMRVEIEIEYRHKEDDLYAQL